MAVLEFLEVPDLPTPWALYRGPDGWTLAVRRYLTVDDVLALMDWIAPPTPRTTQ